MASDSVSHADVMHAPYNRINGRELRSWWARPCARMVAHRSPKRTQVLRLRPSHTYALCLLIWLFVCTLYNKLVIASQVFSRVLCAIQVIDSCGKSQLWKPPDFVATSDRSVGHQGTRYLWLTFEVRAVLWDWAFKLTESAANSGDLGSGGIEL